MYSLARFVACKCPGMIDKRKIHLILCLLRFSVQVFLLLSLSEFFQQTLLLALDLASIH